MTSEPAESKKPGRVQARERSVLATRRQDMTPWPLGSSAMASPWDGPEECASSPLSSSRASCSAVDEGGVVDGEDGGRPRKRGRRNHGQGSLRSPLPPRAGGMPRGSDGRKGEKKTFIYGNYNRYYGYRVGDHVSQDTRVKWLQREWFEGKACLDIGCNEGALTIYIAKEYGVDKMLGIDIDRELIFEARKRLRQASCARQANEPPLAQPGARSPSPAFPGFKSEEGSCPPFLAPREHTGSNCPDIKAEPGIASTAHPFPVSGFNGADVKAEPALRMAHPASGLTGSDTKTEPGVASPAHPKAEPGITPPAHPKAEPGIASPARSSAVSGLTVSGIKAEPGLASTGHPLAALGSSDSDIKAEPGIASIAHHSLPPEDIGAVIKEEPGVASAAHPSAAWGSDAFGIKAEPGIASTADPSAPSGLNAFDVKAEPGMASNVYHSAVPGAAVHDHPTAPVSGHSNLQPRGAGVKYEAPEAADRSSGSAATGEGREETQSCGVPFEAQEDTKEETGAGPSGCTQASSGSDLQERVHFMPGNVLAARIDEGTFDTVLCLSVTKWVHLNWGDRGLIDLFRKIHSALRQGGLLLLEPQPWKSYTRNRGVSEVAQKHYSEIRLQPKDFRELLLDKIGFQQCTLITDSVDPKKGFGRPLYLFKK